MLKEALCFLPSAVVALVTLWIMTSQAKFAFSILLFLLTYFITRCYYNKFTLHVSLPIPSTIRFPSWLIVPILTFFSIFAIKIVPPIEVSYVNWCQIPLANYLRALAAFLIVSFIPGYLILNLLGAKYEFKKIETVIFSYIVSIFVNCSIAYFLNVYFKIFAASFILFSAAFLVLISVLRSSQKWLKRDSRRIVSAKKSYSENFYVIILFLTFIFVCIGLISIFSSNYTLIPGDMWRHHKLPVMTIRSVKHRYFQPFETYLALIFSLSGFPLVNIHILLTFSLLILVAAFFLMMTALLKDKRTSALATAFFVSFAGFGGLLAMYERATIVAIDEPNWQAVLNQVSIETSLDTRYLYSTPFWFTPSAFGFIATFALLYILFKKDDNSRWVCILTAICVALGYLVHGVEIAIFFTALFITSWLYSEKDAKIHIKRCSLGGVAGLSISFLILGLTPGGFLVQLDFQTFLYDLLLLFSLMSVALITFLSDINRFKVKISLPVPKRVNKFSSYILVSYLTGILLIVWNEMRPQLVKNYGAIYSRGLVQWFSYPILLGIPGIITLLSIPYLLKDKIKIDGDGRKLKLVLLLFFITIIVGRVLTAFNSFLSDPLPFWEIRTVYWTRILAVIISACVIDRAFSKIGSRLSINGSVHSKKLCMKMFTAGLMLVLIIVCGISSTLIKIDYWTRNAAFGGAGEGKTVVPLEELEAMDYLRINTPSYGQVLTLTQKSWDVLKCFAGIPNIFHRPEVIFGESDSEFVFQVLSALGVKYVYMAPRDFSMLDEKYGETSIAKRIIQHLPIAFENSMVRIYEIPHLSPPYTTENLALIRSRLTFAFKDDDLNAWSLRTQSGTIKNLSVISNEGVLTLSGSLKSTVRDFYLLDTHLRQISTDDYPYLAVRWRSTNHCAMLEVRYTDGTYLTQYASPQITSRFLPDWTVTTIKQPTNKTVECMIIGVDDRAKTSVGGFQIVQFDYVMLYAKPNSQNTFPIMLIAASGFNYTTVSESDPNRFNYETLIFPNDLMAYDLFDDFTTNSHIWTVVCGEWQFKDKELHQIQTQPYVDAVISTGDSTWSNYIVETKVKAEGDFIDDVGLQFRFEDPKNTYDFRIKSNLVRIGKYVNGSWVELDRTTDCEIKGNTWYKLKASINGDNIKCFIDDTLVFNITDSTFKQGKIALRVEGIHAAFDYINVVTIERLKLLSEYVKWIENGSQVMVLGNSDLGFFASLLNVNFNGETMMDGIKAKNFSISTPLENVPVLSSESPDVRVIASYSRGDVPKSAFALCKDIGFGKLIYINFEPVIRIINDAPNHLKWNLLKQIGSLIGTLINADISTNSSDQCWNYEVIEGIKLSGLIKINSNYLPFPLTSVKASYLDLSTTKHYISSDLESESAIISNVTIQNFKVQGSTNSTLITTHVQLSPLGYGPYLALDFLEEFEWVLELGKGTLMTMEMVRDDLSTYNVTVQEGVIKVKSMPTTLFVRSPIIHVQGETLFDKAYIGWIGSSHPVKSEGYPFKIEGNASLNVECLDGNMVLISALNFNGTAIVYSPPIPSWNEWDIPWSKILVSPYHLLLLCATVTLVVNKRILKIRKIKSRLKTHKMVSP